MLTLSDVKAAVAFYQKAFGFAKRGVMNGPDGKPIHAELTLRGTTLMLGPENPARGMRSARTVPYELMGFKAGDDKLLYAPLDWVGFHYYTRRMVTDASKERFLGGGNFSGTEIENNAPGGRDPYTRFRAAMPTEGPLTDAGLEVWPRGIYDLVTQISREYNHPIIEITLWLQTNETQIGDL